jgi:hypothetical protein
MKDIFPLAAVLALGLTVAAQAKERGPKPVSPAVAGSEQGAKGFRFEKGTPVVVLGEITSPPKLSLGEEKMQVAIGPSRTDYTLHFDGAEVLSINGKRLDEEGLDDGMWVRAEGHVMSSPRRIRITRMQVVAKDRAQLPQSAHFRPGLEHGYITSVAGTRQILPDIGQRARAVPMLLIGQVSDATGAFETTRRIQVKSAGNEWTLHVPREAPVVGAKGEAISVHEIKTGQWIRVQGWRTDDLRLEVTRIENIGKAEALRTSAYYREGAPLGYAEGIPELGMVRKTFTGTITEANVGMDYVTVLLPDRQRLVVWLPAAEIKLRGRSARPTEVKVGDEVELSVLTFK